MRATPSAVGCDRDGEDDPTVTVMGEIHTDISTVVKTMGGLRTAIISPRDPQRTMLAFMGFRACVEPFELQRFQMIAHLWNSQIVLVDAPGMGFAGGRLTRVERRGLRHGDYRPTTDRMVAAATRACPALTDGPVHLLGYSMGCSLAAAVEIDVAQAMLIEPVAGGHWRISSLYKASRDEDRHIATYLDRNREISGAVPPVDQCEEPSPATSWVDLLYLANGMRFEQMARQLAEGQQRHRFPVLVVRGTDSFLSRSDSVDALVTNLGTAGVEATSVSVPGHHGLWQSLPDVQRLCSTLAPQLQP